MSPRTRWYALRVLPGVIMLAGVPVYLVAGNWTAAIVAVAAAIIVVTNAFASRSLYKAGWYGGRVSMHLGVHDINPEPWNDVPPRAPVHRVEFPMRGDRG